MRLLLAKLVNQTKPRNNAVHATDFSINPARMSADNNPICKKSIAVSFFGGTYSTYSPLKSVRFLLQLNQRINRCSFDFLRGFRDKYRDSIPIDRTSRPSRGLRNHEKTNRLCGMYLNTSRSFERRY